MNKPGFTCSAMIVLCFAFAAGSLQAEGESGEGVPKIDVAAAHEYLAQHEDAVIVDVRTPAEFTLSHITGAMNVNVQDENFAELAAELDPDKTYIVHCTKNPVGGRSSRALETLQALGFRNLYNLEGGYLAWQEAELPLTESAPDDER